MTDAPIGASVVRAEEFDHDIRSSLGPERSPDGTRPSRDDFEHLYWPMLAAELAFAWREATQFIDDLPNVRELVCRPTAMFPPARVVINLHGGGAGSSEPLKPRQCLKAQPLGGGAGANTARQMMHLR